MSLELDDKITWVDISTLKPHPKNTNKHPEEQISRLANIIKYQGWRQPIVVSKRSDFIVAGHGRLEAAKKLGLNKVPVSFQHFDDETQELAHMTADNAIALWADLDIDKIKEQLPDFSEGFDLELLGIENMEDILPKEDLYADKDADAIPEVVEPKAKLGQIYKLGEHRLMCGDSTDKATVEKLMNGERADMVFTSPPYNIAKNGFEEKGKYDNDNDDKESFRKFLNESISVWRTQSKYQFFNLQFVSNNKVDIIKWLNDQCDYLVDFIACAKDTTLPAMEKNILNADFEMVYVFGESNRTRHIKIGREFRGTVSNLVQMKRNHKKVTESHRAGFDVSFPLQFIESMTAEGIIVADPFGGTGTTIIACEKTNRKCFMMELDPHYVDVIIARWEQFTGKKAELIDG